MVAGLSFASCVGTSLNAHLTIHWGGTVVGDDPDGRLFARFRNLLDKRLRRRGIPGGLTAIWVLERQLDKRSDVRSEIVHCHMLFHLPPAYTRNPRLAEIESIMEELVDLVGDGNCDDRTIKLTFPPVPDAKYLLKGGTPVVWNAHNVPTHWRNIRGEGVIEAKRCGTTQNIGKASRERYAEGQEPKP